MITVNQIIGEALKAQMFEEVWNNPRFNETE